MSQERTQGQGSLAIQTAGYTTVSSRLLGPVGAVSDHIAIDLKVPSDQPSPYWIGAFQDFVSAPSLGVYAALA